MNEGLGVNKGYYDPHYKPGWLTVIVGPMYSGKSGELISRVQKLKYHRNGSGFRFGFFKPTKDTRNEDYLYSRGCDPTFKAFLIPETDPDKLLVKADTLDVFAIDEAQFFDKKLVGVVNKLVDARKHVIVAGLDTDFAGRGYRGVPALMHNAHELQRVLGYCMWTEPGSSKRCCRVGVRTQRLLNGKPAPISDPLDIIQNTEGVDEQGNERTYQCRCIEHHQVLQE